jgi:hypothetical protein
MKKVFFCPACGYAGDAPDRTRRCPKCGQKLSSMLVGEKTRSELTEGEAKSAPAPRPAAARNGVASLLGGIAIALSALALIAGVVLLVLGKGLVCMAVLAAGLVAGSLILGVSELIQVTQDGFARLADLQQEHKKDGQ